MKHALLTPEHKEKKAPKPYVRKPFRRKVLKLLRPEINLLKNLLYEYGQQGKDDTGLAQSLYHRLNAL